MPAPTYRIDELAHLAGVSARTIRFYVERGLLPGPRRRGAGSPYTQEHLARLFAIERLRDGKKLRLDVVKRRLAQLSAAEIAAMLPPSAPAQSAETSTSAPLVPYQRWDYVELIPGLELRIRSDASPVLRRLAQEIHGRYAAAAITKDTETT
ncbi:Transcriptional regulator, MerR family protein [Minicystis rosea]|nr:Transcriptional regulator, MerR family protein [Minicystis rosea]